MGVNANFWSGKSVLVTGHTGFKGTWLCLWLDRLGARVYGLSLPEPGSSEKAFSILQMEKLVDDCRGDINLLAVCTRALEKAEPEIIFHMAAQSLVRESYVQPLNTLRTNIIGTANILETIRGCESVKAVVVVTSDKCYENIERDHGYIETDPLSGRDPYSSSKACAEHVAHMYYHSFLQELGLGVATARAGNVIGGGDWSADRLIPDAVRAWTNNRELLVRYPLAIRPWQHVLEPLSGYLCLAERLWDQAVNYSGGWNFGPDRDSEKTVEQTVQLAAREWGGSAIWGLSEDPQLHEAGTLRLNNEKAKNLLGWQPRLTLDKAVSETIRWYQEYYQGGLDMKNFTLNQITNYEYASKNNK